jgi:glycerol-3-phosphate dehydrogenase
MKRYSRHDVGLWMRKYDSIVIGGGLLGCFALRSLARYRVRAALFETREDICTGISRANTAIVYAGYDNKPGSLKSAMCVSASQSFQKLCRELGVRYSPCGSLMICFGERGERVLQRKFGNGKSNGVRGLALLSREQVLELEPNLRSDVYSGLYAPDSGTVIPWELGQAAAENALNNGGEILLNSRVAGIQRADGGYCVMTEGARFFTRAVINCAGLSADSVSEMIYAPSVRINRSSGSYYILDTKTRGFIRHVIFHEPEEKGKGLTLVPTVSGNILIGPTESPASDDGFAVSLSDLRQLRKLVCEVIPSLPLEHIIRSFGAIRPNPVAVGSESKSIHDFCIQESASNFISLIGVKTPGLTCADQLGRYTAERVASHLGADINTEFSPIRQAPIQIDKLSSANRKRLVDSDPRYGRIVCRCRGITEGEIISAIRRMPGAVTIDGVKRRTGTCSGRCQGSFCTQRIIELLARELGSDVSGIPKDGAGSYIVRKAGARNGI